MAKKGISFEELFDKYRLILNLKYLDRIFTDDNVHRDFYTKIQAARLQGVKDETFVKNYFMTHVDSIDREAYIFYTYKTIVEELGPSMYPEVAENCKRALKNSHFVHFEPRITADGNDVEIVKITAKTLLGEDEEINVANYLDRWNKATERVTPISFFSYASNTELSQFCSSPSLVGFLTRLNFVRVIEKFYDLTPEEKIKFLDGADNLRLEKLVRECADKLDINSDDITCFYKEIPNYVERFPEFFDTDKIFLIAAFKASEFLEGADLSGEENEKYTALFRESLQAIKRRGTKVQDIVSFIDPSGKRDVSYKELEPLLKNITPSGHYVSQIEKDQVISRITAESGRLVALMEEDPEILKTIGLTDAEYEEILTENGMLAFLTLTDLTSRNLVMKKYRNMEISEFDFEILTKSDYFKREEVLAYCSKMETIGPDLFQVLHEKGHLDASGKIDFFIQGKYDYELLDRLPDEEKNKIKEALTTDKFVELFLNKDKDEENENIYNRYLRLFRNFKLKGLDRDGRIAVDEEIIELFGDNLDDDILRNLYKSHVITFQTLKEWAGNNVISQMMAKTEIRPEDVKEMCVDGDYEALFAVLSNEDIPKSRKMAIFRTSFANIDYDELDEAAKENLLLARDEALRLINLKDEKSSGKGPTTGIKRGKGTGKRFNEYISDPQLRWDLIDLMGDYSYEMLDQGLAIFKFPDFKGGTIVLEKMYKKDKPEYGRATKIINMSIEDFEKIKPGLIDNDDIPPFMVDTHPALQGRITNINHTTAWGRQFAQYFEYDIGDQRTPEEIDRIERKIQSILNSRELR